MSEILRSGHTNVHVQFRKFNQFKYCPKRPRNQCFHDGSLSEFGTVILSSHNVTTPQELFFIVWKYFQGTVSPMTS